MMCGVFQFMEIQSPDCIYDHVNRMNILFSFFLFLSIV
jgi:hypothetical protein